MDKVTRYIVPKAQAWPVDEQDTPRMAHEQLMVLAKDYEDLQARNQELEAYIQRALRVRGVQ